MSRETYELESPFLNLSWNQRPKNWRALLAAWIIAWLAFFIALIGFYATYFKDLVGFQTAVLVGLGIIMFFLTGID